METATITLTRKRVHHEDDEAAGFTRGYWWTLTDRHGTTESGARTKAQAREAALRAARAHGYTDDEVEVLDG